MEQLVILQAAAPQSTLMTFAPILIVGVIFYLLIFMPMRKRQKKEEEMRTALRPGDRVITSSGIYGVVAGVKEKTFIIKVADQVKIEIAKNAIAGVQGPEETGSGPVSQ
ncbi:MAG: preprotein translocase subunit YajC [Acidobacteriota bacterium]|jgi:preprotein translocase subunit YajC|nr:preprotein translocase subunit YajC [Acidobacteriota bacterium]